MIWATTHFRGNRILSKVPMQRSPGWLRHVASLRGTVTACGRVYGDEGPVFTGGIPALIGASVGRGRFARRHVVNSALSPWLTAQQPPSDAHLTECRSM